MPTKLQEEHALVAHNFESTLKGGKKLQFHEFSKFNLGSVGVFVAIKGTSPWEYHPDSDEFLQILEGVADIEVLTDAESVVTHVTAGHCFVVPRAHWHRHIVTTYLRELFVTPGSTEHSSAKDPRKAKASKTAPKSARKNWVDDIREFALTFPEVREDLPWGYPAWKVRNKTFAAVSFQEHGIRLTVKLTTSRLSSLALPFVEPSGHGWGEHGWITAALKHDENRISADVIKSWITESFRAVAPKSVLKEFDASLIRRTGK